MKSRSIRVRLEIKIIRSKIENSKSQSIKINIWVGFENQTIVRDHSKIILYRNICQDKCYMVRLD